MLQVCVALCCKKDWYSKQLPCLLFQTLFLNYVADLTGDDKDPCPFITDYMINSVRTVARFGKRSFVFFEMEDKI